MGNLSKKRIEAIDLARGIGVFFIPMAHTLLIYGSSYTQEESWLGLVVHFFGKWAGVFLIAMGFSYTLSRNNSVINSIKRGVLLMLVGYLMNFLKFIMPILLGLIPDSFIHAYGWERPIGLDKMVYLILTGDILQLAGVCLIFMGIIHKYSQKYKYLVVYIAATVLILTEFVRGTRAGIPALDYILDLLWGKDWNIYFAVFPWFVFILVGMFFGYYFKENEKNVQKTFKLMLLAGAVTFIIGGALCLQNYEFHMRDYFHTGIGGVVYLIGCNLLFFWLSLFILKKFKSNRVTDLFFYCSRKITSIYVIQWVLICWSMGFVGYHNKDITTSLILMVLFTIGTFLVQKIIDVIMEKVSFKPKKTSKEITVKVS
ncbi:Peptidoglycan/LPS O-acetylase OafA/YrhL, contains acyltransferase and SGNH-hydrolase domains [Tenacibaculum sp. MAR_2009_124]|uniref:heparan-alpha-glucosaminide N-acetyltransferase domain-containing protein n=1 Tax=Tenacibaculum sp. MAR_2009_124 TaxID=1250059 RepID=UPI000899832F|nr:heparan-alpha-glucosaminide N-acetyltransferase domain-containing protein [Tenacibaculum sp. MAR_2009_124]SEB44407.1 Peptidoglycan/LPS O-acetylase OafA/YrhL, contains acyltransferase and SGNH-hydrolase domains [Tenacibaculum sp. MAR_2009_124]